jgi:hypothetical protein
MKCVSGGNYNVTQRYHDNVAHALTIRDFWAEQGVEVEVTVNKDGIRTYFPSGYPADIDPMEARGASAFRQIEDEVSEETGVTLLQMRGKSHKAFIVEARQAAMYRMRREINPAPSWKQIAGRFNCDHSTVIAAVRRHAERENLPSVIND